MAPDLLSTIRLEIDERLSELRPLPAEYERLLMAADALVATGREGSVAVAKTAAPATRARRETRVGTARRGSAAGAIERAAAGQPAAAPRRSPAKPKPERAARGAAREAILAALDHGSHTVGELAVVTAMSSPNINGNLRRLFSEGAVVKTEREGKTAWALPDAVS
jgi:DNA-binding transcriptional ArsR family regulator